MLVKSYVDVVDVCNIPIGKDDTGGSAVWVLYREWLYRSNMPKIRSKKVQKLEENVEFELNGSFRGAGELKLGPNGSKNILYSNPRSVCSQINVFGLFRGIRIFQKIYVFISCLALCGYNKDALICSNTFVLSTS